MAKSRALRTSKSNLELQKNIVCNIWIGDMDISKEKKIKLTDVVTNKEVQIRGEDYSF